MSSRMLEGQVALVTGAGRGLGRAFAERLASLGCHIAVHGMRERGPSEYGGTETLTDVAHGYYLLFRNNFHQLNPNHFFVLYSMINL